MAGVLRFFSVNKKPIIGGLIFGILSAIAVNAGNPDNMGLCVACFLRDIAGALRLHATATVQYMRPEIFGFILGAFGTSILYREWKPRGGSSPILRFVLAMCVMTGAMVYLGCPSRALLRLSGGDLSALVAIPGMIVGIMIGIFFMKRGFSLGRASKMPAVAGLIIPLFAIVLFVLLIIKFDLLAFSSGAADGSFPPGARYVNPWVGLGLGVIVGFIAQRTRFCSIGAWRDVILVRNFHLFSGVVAFFVGALLVNYAVGNFGDAGLFGLNLSPEGRVISYHWGITNQPAALPYASESFWTTMSQYAWSFLSFTLVGLAATFMGGCPLRNTILAGEGDTDAGISLIGYVVGGAVAMNFLIVSTKGGMGQYGGLAVAIGLVFCIALGFIMQERQKA